jgi:hypothetical protein
MGPKSTPLINLMVLLDNKGGGMINATNFNGKTKECIFESGRDSKSASIALQHDTA